MVALYLDSSAIVKLVVSEPESKALRAHVVEHHPLVTSALSRAEVARAVLRGGPAAAGQARSVLDTLGEVVITRAVLDDAGRLDSGVRLRTFDAIHLASALRLGDEVATVVTYDQRMAEAARAFGFTVDAPR